MKTIDALRTTFSKFPAEYARGRAAHAVLAPFADALAVDAALGLSSSLSHADRDAITLALITEHQRSTRPIWQALLLSAYEPMLANVRRRLIDKNDAEQRIVLAFLEAIAKVSLAHPPSFLALTLRHATERAVFGTGAASREQPEMVSLGDARREMAPEDLESQIELRQQKEKLLGELVHVFGDDAEEVLEVLLAARTGREALEDLVARNHPNMTPRQRIAAYERLQRLRRRALVHLQDRFGRAAEDDRSVA